MQSFRCPVCAQLLFFDNSSCLQCGSELGFDVGGRELVALRRDDDADGILRRSDGSPGSYRRCANQLEARCNWVLPADESALLCRSCRLTSVRPNDSDADAMAAFAHAEAAKRRLIDQVLALGLPLLDRTDEPERGVTFELLSSRGRSVTTGHQAGVITLDLSESDDAHREFVRLQLGEQYRTVLGHLRHEIGHYFWPLLVVEGGAVDEFRTLFGDERQSYQEALDRHYLTGPGSEWPSTHVSQYATMHPWEDWAETFAHYLHICDGLETASEFGIEVGDPSRAAGERAWPSVTTESTDDLVRRWLTLTLALNAMSRSIGESDLYPFVLSPAVVEKLDFVRRVSSPG
ncbi:MAG: putative zinc-binding metallopeptidase [Ilumatobacteraceae bacterium]|nr:putative zinc-binding metallopeptidase [Ilumatobacteraceae bacterium]